MTRCAVAVMNTAVNLLTTALYDLAHYTCVFSLNYFLILRADSNRNICYVIGTLSSYMTGTGSYHAGYAG